MSNPADSVTESSQTINIGSSPKGYNKSVENLSTIVKRLRWTAKIKSVESVDGTYKVEIPGYTDIPGAENNDGILAKITRPDDKWLVNQSVMVNVDEHGVAWILPIEFPRTTGQFKTMMILDELNPGTWGADYARFSGQDPDTKAVEP